jgi:toxin-antitoxin system PIN domain toxin
MIAVDTNLLVYAHRADSDWHGKASAALAGLAEGAGAWAIPWPCLHEFLAIVTHPRIFRTPTPADLALGQIEAWLESPSLVVLSENDDHFDVLRDLVTASRVVGPRVHDARVAALCVGHGVRELWTADRDFSAFPGLRQRNPLVA